MRNIKVRERDRTPKVRKGTARLPKELMKESLIRAKGKVRDVSRLSETNETDATPEEYAGEKVRSAQERVLIDTGNAGIQTFTAGKHAAKKSYEKIRQRKKEDIKEELQREEQAEQENLKQIKAEKECSVQESTDSEKIVRERTDPVKKDTDSRNEKDRKATSQCSVKEQKTDARAAKEQIKTKPEQREVVYREKHLSIKEAPKTSGASIRNAIRIRDSRNAYGNVEKQSMQPSIEVAKKQAVKAKAAEQMIQQYVKQTTQMTKRTAGTARKILEAIEKAFHAAKAVGMLAGLIGGMAMMVLIVIVGILGGVLFSSTSQSTMPLSEEVIAYTPLIEKYANEYGIGAYVQVIQAIMMQESAGRGTDPMQCSECPYNTQFPNTPGAITDPEYSIQVGIRYYKDCIEEAGCSSPQDMDKLKLSLQGYNYGNGYITWAMQNYGGYSEANALQFSQVQAAAHGWERYGDPEYVPHVLRYYSSGNIFAGLFGNGQMVSVALSQLGNNGGQKFWSWYGFDSYVAWCACFVSWCGDQCGLIESGAMPKFSYCDDAITWFQAKDKWQGRDYIPAAGTLIFFDWMQNGTRDGVSDHVGIVEKYEDGIVYTVEGNSSNSVRQRNYVVGDISIIGYGIISY